MSNRKLTPLEKASFNLSEWIDTTGAQTFRRNRKRVKVWSKRLELFFGFIPAFLVWLITYGKKFR